MKPMGVKWVFVVKKDGRYQACLVALGYSQLHGRDVENSYSLVVYNASLRILLKLGIKRG